MSESKKPSKPRGKKKIDKLIEDLPFFSDIARMLIGNSKVTDVVYFVQHEKGELTDISPEILAKALGEVRKKIRGTDKWWGGSCCSVSSEDDEELLARINYRRMPVTPLRASRFISERVEGGIVDMLELEAMYLAQRDRCDRLIELEALSGSFGDITTNAIDSASEILWKRIQARYKMNVGDSDSMEVNLSIKRYSKETVDVLNNPESRHRIMSLLERVTRYSISKRALPVPEELPLPKSTSEK